MENKKIKLNPNFQFQWEEKQNCYALLYPEGMVQLNQSAGEILNLCDGEKGVEEINKILCKNQSKIILASALLKTFIYNRLFSSVKLAK